MMTNLGLWTSLPLIALGGIFSYKRLRLYLHFFQQEEYDNKRFFFWLFKKRFFDKKLTATLIVVTWLVNTAPHSWKIFLPLIFALAVFIFITREKNPLTYGKKPLLLTKRAVRILTLATFFGVTSFLLGFYIAYQGTYLDRLPFSFIIAIQALPLALITANLVLSPAEFLIQHKIIRAAKDKLAEINPLIIGITGSYGKTSVKQILAYILSRSQPTLSTPGSINTVMGICRIIREQLLPGHKIFIVEMGAYRRGSIHKLCQLTPPKHGILTAIGHAHYERFKNTLTMAKTKFELVQAVLENEGGLVVINLDSVNQNFITEFTKSKQQNQIITLGSATAKKAKAPQVQIEHIQQKKEGISFDLMAEGKTHAIQSPLYGTHQANNIALAFVLAQKLGLSASSILETIKTLPQIEHRLAVLRSTSGMTIIDNAYNSNPVGFKTSLALLKTLCEPNGRKILITPGMVELGKLHHELHFELGQLAGDTVDYALVVMPKRIKSFIKGFLTKKDNASKLLTFNSFFEAKDWLDQHAKPGDVILYENDLTDIYESSVTL